MEFKEMFDDARKPDKLNVLWLYRNELSKKKLTELLSYWWVLTEFPNQYPKYVINDLFKKAEQHLLMTEGNDFKVFNCLPEKINVYRGMQDLKQGKMKIKAFSWTTSKDVAKWFSERYSEHLKIPAGKIYSAKIYKKDIYMYRNARGEQEIVLNPDKLMDIQEVPNEVKRGREQ